MMGRVLFSQGLLVVIMRVENAVPVWQGNVKQGRGSWMVHQKVYFTGGSDVLMSCAGCSFMGFGKKEEKREDVEVIKLGAVVQVDGEPCIVSHLDKDFVWVRNKVSGVEQILLRVMLERPKPQAGKT